MDELAILPLLASKIKIREDSTNKNNCSDDEEIDAISSDEEGDSCEFYKFFP